MFNFSRVFISPPNSRDVILDDVIADLARENVDSDNLVDVDFRNLDVVDQGEYSCCVAISGVTLKTLQTHTLPLSGDGRLSYEFVYNGRELRTVDGGMCMRNMMTILYRYGAPEKRVYGSEAIEVVSPDNAKKAIAIRRDILDNAAANRILGYGRIYTLETVIHAFQLNNRSSKFKQCFGGLAIVTRIYNTSTEFWKPHAKQIVTPLDKAYYHCFVIRGFDMEQQQLILQNSWGTAWGNRGFTSMAFDDFSKYMIECWYCTSNAELRDAIKERVATSKFYTNFGNGNLEPDNLLQGKPSDVNIVLAEGKKKKKTKKIVPSLTTTKPLNAVLGTLWGTMTLPVRSVTNIFKK